MGSRLESKEFGSPFAVSGSAHSVQEVLSLLHPHSSKKTEL